MHAYGRPYSCLNAAAVSRSTLACLFAVLSTEDSGRRAKAVTGSPPPFLAEMYEYVLFSVIDLWEEEHVVLCAAMVCEDVVEDALSDVRICTW